MKEEAKGEGAWDEYKHRHDEGVGQVCQHDCEPGSRVDLVLCKTIHRFNALANYQSRLELHLEHMNVCFTTGPQEWEKEIFIITGRDTRIYREHSFL